MQRIYFNGNWKGYVEITTELLGQNNVDATSNVRVTARIGQDPPNAIDFGDVGAYLGLYLGGVSKYLYFGEMQLNGNSRLLGTLDFTLTHDEVGNVDSDLKIWSWNTEGLSWNGLNWGSLTHTISISVPQIIRSGIIESVSNITYIGESVTVKIKDNESGLKHQVWYRAFGSYWIDLGKNIDNEITFNTDRELYKKSGNSDTGYLDISVRTFKDGKPYGGDVYKENIPIKIPEEIRPKISDIVFTDNYAKSKKLNIPIFLQNLSDIDYEVQTATDSITEPKTFYVSIEGTDRAYFGKTGNIGSFHDTGSVTFRVYAKDIRGRTSNTIKKTVQVLQYKSPKLLFVVRRSGARNETLTVTRTAKIEPLIHNGVQYNSFSLKFYTKRIEDEYFTENQGGSLETNSTYQLLEHSANLHGAFQTAKSFVVKGVLKDAFSEAEYIFTVSTEDVVYSYSPDGIGVKKIWEHGALDVGGDVWVGGYLAIKNNRHSLPFTGNVDTLTRAGNYYVFNSTNIPATAGYLIVSSHPDNDQYAVQHFTPFNSSVTHVRRREKNVWTQWTNVWTDVTLTNGWRKYYDSHYTLQYKINNNGSVELRGSISGGNSKNGQMIFKMPNEIKTVKQSYAQAVTGDYKPCVITIYNNGTVICGNGVESSWLCFDGITISN